MKKSMITIMSTVAFSIGLMTSVNAQILDEIEKSFSVASNAEFQLDNINGSVEVKSWDESQIKVIAKITTENQESRDRIEILMSESSNSVTVETKYKKNSSWGNNNSGKVEYVITLPKDIASTSLELVNGSLVIEHVNGDIEAELVNGSIKASGISGNGEFQSVNGSIKVEYLAANEQLNKISTSTVNGSIKLSVTDLSGATVNAETVHGSISNDFGLNVEKNMFSGRNMQGSFGDGSVDIKMESVNGSVKLLRN